MTLCTPMHVCCGHCVGQAKALNARVFAVAVGRRASMAKTHPSPSNVGANGVVFIHQRHCLCPLSGPEHPLAPSPLSGFLSICHLSCTCLACHCLPVVLASAERLACAAHRLTKQLVAVLALELEEACFGHPPLPLQEKQNPLWCVSRGCCNSQARSLGASASPVGIGRDASPAQNLHLPAT